MVAEQELFQSKDGKWHFAFYSICFFASAHCHPTAIFYPVYVGEDRCLMEQYFKTVCTGKYLEVGAVDGIQSSITYAFHKTLGWTGVNIEVDPESYEKLSQNRKGDIANVNAATCTEPRQVHYISTAGDEVGGVWEFASEAHRAQHWPNMTIYNGIPVQCSPLQSILDRTVSPGKKKYFFDLMVIDVEGAELSALLGIDFERMSFGIIIVERNEDAAVNQRIVDLLVAKGYKESYVEDECGANNMWYIAEDFPEIYQSLNPTNNFVRRR